MGMPFTEDEMVSGSVTREVRSTNHEGCRVVTIWNLFALSGAWAVHFLSESQECLDCESRHKAFITPPIYLTPHVKDLMP